jgi:hypothetical protein
MKSTTANQRVPTPLQFCGVGDSDEFFDLVVLIGDGRQIEREVQRNSVPS